MRLLFVICALALPAAAAFAQSPPNMVKVGDQMKRATGTVNELQPGDRGCYMIMKDNRGVEFTEITTSDICGMHIIGKRVALIYRMEPVMAMECQGNPRCKKTDTMPVVVDIKVMK